MEATHDRIIVQLIQLTTETASGIKLPVLNPEGPREAVVISAGPGRLLDTGELIPLSVRKNDRVLISQHVGAEFQNEDGTFFTIKDEDILAVIEG